MRPTTKTDVTFTVGFLALAGGLGLWSIPLMLVFVGFVLCACSAVAWLVRRYP